MKTIFILEDEKSIRELLEFLFNMEGYNVISASNITEFNNLHSRQPVDLYLLDIRVPDGSGIDVCNKLKSDIQTENIPVVLMSAHAKTAEIEQKCSPNAFISKPFDLDDIVTSISTIIEK